MCTVTIIPVRSEADGASGFRLVASRDEQRTRAAALPPQWQDLPAGGRAISPIDPEGEGTWIAATSHGLALCLLNANPRPLPPLPPPHRLVSRGAVIPNLLHHHDALAAARAVQSLDVGRFAPFTLLAVHAATTGDAVLAAVAEWNGRTLRVDAAPGLPLCLVSSGLGDDRVLPRLPLFNSMLRPRPLPDVQDQFHLHVWPDRPEISVLMSRADARTVSITTVEVLAGRGPARVALDYRPIPALSPAPLTQQE